MLRCILCFLSMAAYSGVAISVEPIDWYQQGAAAADAAGKVKANKRKAKNIILFVGDGMGVSTVTAARILDGQQRGQSGEENVLSFEKFPHLALSKTYNTNQQTPDSAGTMTAMATGVKTKAGVLSLPPTVKRGECNPNVKPLATIVELAEQRGWATGLVSTAEVTHATPAATYAHVSERGWQTDSKMSAKVKAAGCVDIAQQLLNFPYGDGVDVVLGGGRSHFLPKTQKGPEGNLGERSDGQNLIRRWLRSGQKRSYVWNQSEFAELKPEQKGQVLGLFEAEHMEFELDRAKDEGGEPSLAEMTKFAIKRLQASSDKGFFLLVEAGRIDHGHHLGNARRALEDVIALAEAVDVAVNSVDVEDTLIVVTADHSHVMTMAGYPTRGNPILGFVRQNGKNGEPKLAPATDNNGKPYTTLSYANGPGFIEDCDDVTHMHANPLAPSYLQVATYPLRSETHGGEDVAIYAIGAGAHRVRGVQEQNVIFHVMAQAAGF